MLDNSVAYLVVTDEEGDRKFSNLTDIVVTLFFSETGKTNSRLTTSSVLLGKIDLHLVYNFTGVTRQGAEKSTVTIHNNEAELCI